MTSDIIFAIGATIAATAAPITAVYKGRMLLTLALRCKPQNISFRQPNQPEEGGEDDQKS